MLYHFFRNVDLSNLLFFDQNWKQIYEECFRDYKHSLDSLKDFMIYNLSSSNESLIGDKNNNLNHQDEKLLALRNPHHNDDVISVQTDLGRRSEDLDHNWL